ncbi:KdsC family phosphatase [Desulfonauticus submarinus]
MKSRVFDLAKKIKLLVLDVDGVLTDGGLYYNLNGQVLKRFDVQDGMGIKIAQRVGLKIAVISGLRSEVVKARLDELGVLDYFPGYNHKLPKLKELKEKNVLQWSEIAYLGDDWVDAAPLKQVGLPMAVANAVPEIKKLALWVSSKKGGHGAVREAIMFILAAQNKLNAVWKEWVSLD